MSRRPSPLMRVLAGGMSVALLTLTCLPPDLAYAAEQRIRFFHPDHLGSTNVVTDETGQVVEVIEYKPFGEVYKITGPDRVPHTFTGQRLDDSTGLYFYNARYYDPQLGRFIQPDTIVQDPEDPQTLNRYTYVRNNPVNLIDPSGHFFQFLIPIFIAALKGAAIGAVVGAAVNATVAAFTGQSVGEAAWRGAVVGFAAGAVGGAGSFFLSPTAGLTLGTTAKFMIGATTATAAGALGGGIDSAMQGGSFGHGAAYGAALGLGVFASGVAIGAGFAWLASTPLGEGLGQGMLGIGQAIASSSVGRGIQRGLSRLGLTASGSQETSNIVYRALNVKDAERLAAGLGLEAKNPAGTWTAAQHIARGSSRAAVANDPWIATTSNLNVAGAFNSGYGIAKIDLAKVPGLRVRVWEYAPRVNGQAGIPYHRSIWQQETSIYRNIPRDAILE